MDKTAVPNCDKLDPANGVKLTRDEYITTLAYCNQQGPKPRTMLMVGALLLIALVLLQGHVVRYNARGERRP